jgi:transcription elongation factor Elf1
MDKEINCLRCNKKLVYLGVYKFHEGRRYGVLGELGELLVRKRKFEIYECPECGKAEFYVVKK